MLKVLPSKFIPMISAGHEEYKSKRGEAWEGVQALWGLRGTFGPGESGHMPRRP